MSKRRSQGSDVDLKAMVASGAEGAYEALQLWRSRAIRQRARGEKENALLATTTAVLVLAEGAKCLLDNGYLNAGAELALLLVDFLNDALAAGVKFDDASTSQQVDLVLSVCSHFQQLLATSTSAVRVACADFQRDMLKAAIKWSVRLAPSDLGDLKLHIALGECLWASAIQSDDSATIVNGVLRSAVYHLCVGEAPLLLLPLISSLSAPASPSSSNASSANSGNGNSGNGVVFDKEQALTLAVLSFLAQENLRDAHRLFDAFSAANASDNVNANTANASKDDDLLFLSSLRGPESALLRFNRFLLAASLRDCGPLFKQLVSAFKGKLDFDEAVPALLSGPVGQRLFGLQAQVAVNPMLNMLQQMLSK